MLAQFTPPDVTKMLPSTTNRFFTSWLRPQLFTTEVAGSSPMRAVPIRCQPVGRTGPAPMTSLAPAARITSSPRSSPCCISFKLFSLYL